MSVNKVIIVGNLGKDPEVKKLGDNSVCNFTVATSEKWEKDGETKEKTEWHRITAWGKLAEICGKYLAKGKQVYIEGKLQTRSYDKEGTTMYSTEIVASTVQFLGSAKSADSVDNSVESVDMSPKTPAKKTVKNHAPTFDATEEMPF